MKHLIPFLEAVNDKKTISLNTYRLVNYLPGIFGLGSGIRFSKYVGCVIKNNFTEDPNRNKNPRYLDNIKNPQITMRFKDVIDVTKMSKHLKSNFTNKFSVKDKTITIDVENVEVKTNFIEEHKEDIEDALIEFQDMEYVFEYIEGSIVVYDESYPFDSFHKNYERKEVPITAYSISIMTKDNREEDEDNYLADKYNYIVDMIKDIEKYIYHGSNVSYIENHVKAGVLMTYLIRKDDKNINDPVANLDIKPYFNIFDPSDIFLYPDTSMYGHGTPDYRDTVMKWVTHVNKGKVGMYRLMDGIYNDNLQNKTLLVLNNGKVIDENKKPGAYGYETDKKTLKLYSEIMKDIKSDEEAEIYIQYVIKNIGDMSICGDLQSDILFYTPEKWRKFYKKTSKRIRGWLI